MSNYCEFDYLNSHENLAERIAFTGYVNHIEELNKIVDKAIKSILNGDTMFTTSEYLTSDDLNYIKKEVERRMR